MTADPSEPALVLAARGPFRLPAVAVSHGWFQTVPVPLGSGGGAPRPRGGARRRRAHAHHHRRRRRRRREGVRAPLGRRAVEVVRTRVTRMLQLDADLDGFAEATCAVDPDLARDLADYGGGRMLAGGSLFEDVVKGLCGTNTTWRQAVNSINRLGELGPGGAFPSAADLLRAGRGPLPRPRPGRLPGPGAGRCRPRGDRRAHGRDRGRLRRRRRGTRLRGADRAQGHRPGHRQLHRAPDGALRPALGQLRDDPRRATDTWFDGRKPTPARCAAGSPRPDGSRASCWPGQPCARGRRTTGIVSPD